MKKKKTNLEWQSPDKRVKSPGPRGERARSEGQADEKIQECEWRRLLKLNQNLWVEEYE